MLGALLSPDNIYKNANQKQFEFYPKTTLKSYGAANMIVRLSAPLACPAALARKHGG
jgi:hypothetical protein